MRLLCNTISRPICGVSFGPQATTLLAGGSGGFDLWDLTSLSHSFIPSHAVKCLWGCMIEPQGRWAYLSDPMGGFRLVPLQASQAPQPPGSEYQRHVTSFGITRNGDRLVMNRGGAGMNRVECWKVRASGAFDSAWSLRDGELIAPEDPFFHNQAQWFTNAVAVSADGKRVVTAESRSKGSSDGHPLLVLRQGSSGEAITEPGNSVIDFAGRLVFAADGQAVFAWSDRVLERWDLQAGRRTHHTPAPGRAGFSGLTAHPSGRFLISASGDGQARYWSSLDLAPMKAIKCGVGKLHSISVSRDGRMAAAGGEKGHVAVWDVETDAVSE